MSAWDWVVTIGGWVLWAATLLCALSWTRAALAMRAQGKWFPNNISTSALLWLWLVASVGFPEAGWAISRWHLAWLLQLAPLPPLAAWYWDVRRLARPRVRLGLWVLLGAALAWGVCRLSGSVQIVLGSAMTVACFLAGSWLRRKVAAIEQA